MTKYREILRLKSLGFSERNIAHSCGVSRNTVARVVKQAAEMNLSWPLDHDMTVSVMLYITALACAPRTVFTVTQFFLPIVKFLSARSPANSHM